MWSATVALPSGRIGPQALHHNIRNFYEHGSVFLPHRFDVLAPAGRGGPSLRTLTGDCEG